LRQRPRHSQQRRDQILVAAVRVIAARGLAETRVADVAEEAGTSAALVIYYFESKDRLLTEALAYAEDRFYLETFHRLTAVDSASDRLLKLIQFSVPDGSVDELDDWVLWIELWARSLRDSHAARKRSALDRRWRAIIADVVQSGLRSGEFVDVEPEDFAIQLAALIDGLAVQVILKDEEVTSARVLEVCLEFADHQLGLRQTT
jgi:AcrR family transcriptional regulator